MEKCILSTISILNVLPFQGLLVAILYCFVNKEVRQIRFDVKSHFNFKCIFFVRIGFLLSVFLLPSFICSFVSLKTSSSSTFFFLLSANTSRHDRIHLLICSLLNAVFGKEHPSIDVLCVLFNLHHHYLSCLSHHFLSQVQSEMLKKWKRWKLGKDIDEEYRHTHSQTPHVKSGSIATGNVPNTSDPNADWPRFNKANSGPVCSAATEENRKLVVSFSNGTGKCRPAKSRHTLHFSFQSHRGATSSTATEDVCLEERVKYRSYTLEGEETNV